MEVPAPAPPSHEVRLRAVIESDLSVFFEHQRDADANRMAAFPPRDRDAFMSHWTRKVLADSSVHARTILVGDNVAGHVVSWEQESKRLIGYWIGKSFWGRGVTTNALTEFLIIVDSRPLFAYVAQHNLGSIRVLEKCGFSMCDEPHRFTRSLLDDGIDDLVFKLKR